MPIYNPPSSSQGGAVSSVAGKTGNVTLAKADVGLANVNDTSDASKPVSSAQQTALNGKSDTGHTHAQLHNQQHSITSASDHTFPGGTTTYLRADGTFGTPSGGSDPFIAKLVLAGNVNTAANTTPVNVSGLVFNFEANSKYIMELFATMQSPVATTGYGLQWDVSVAVTTVTMQFVHQLANTGTLSGGSSIADDASAGVSSGVPTANTNVPLYAAGILVTAGNAGTAQLRLRSETTAIATMVAGSMLRVMKVA